MPGFKRVFFPIYVDYSVGKGSSSRRKVEKLFGYFSCLENVAEFLDIPDDKKAGATTYVRVIESYQRTIKRIGGKEVQSAAGGSTVSSSRRLVGFSAGGNGRSVKIKTGAPIADSKAKKPGGTHQISFNFPTNVTLRMISEALAEIIPEGKLGSPPGATEIWPYFKVAGKYTYPIAKKSAALSAADVKTGDDTKTVNPKLTQEP